ncbi:hypothetical protein NQZ68_001398, partial [Dissostichus eleginoides]
STVIIVSEGLEVPFTVQLPLSSTLYKSTVTVASRDRLIDRITNAEALSIDPPET